MLGYPDKEYSGHSFRRGGATWAMHIGLPGEVIQVLGDWQSNVYQRYTDMNFVERKTYISKLTDQLPTIGMDKM